MSPSAFFIDNRPISLGKKIGKGGEGEVFVLGDDPSHAVKLYTVNDVQSREKKIAAMVSAGYAKHAPLIAFPLSIVRTRGGAFAGFSMRLVAEHKPLHELYAPGSRKQHFPQADYRFLVRTASNIARAVASVHHSGCVIGDLNHSGILISKRATVSLIDADSFQVIAGANRYLCRVGVPEYTPPELQGRALSEILRTTNHDAFGLAVIIFQLLFMGRHPFVGTVRRGDIPPLQESIRDYRFVYDRNRDVGMDQPPGTPAIEDFSGSIATAFEAAFGKNTAQSRPTANAWIQVLDELESSLVQCSENALHYGPRVASDCPWCDMEEELGTVLFYPFIQKPGIVAAFDPGANGFNIDAVWRGIHAFKVPTRSELSPRLNIPTSSPSAEAVGARRSHDGTHASHAVYKVVGVLVGFGAVAGFFMLPQLWFLWLAAAWWGFFSERPKPSDTVKGESFLEKYIQAETVWQKEMANWLQRSGYADIESLAEELARAKNTYKSLIADERRQLDQYKAQRRERQLHAYFETFDVQHARVKGIGPAKLAALASYGIDTAADASLQKLLNVPGFGPKYSKSLVEWRNTLEKKFHYSEKPNETDRMEVAKICAAVESKAATLRRKLLAGRHNLDNLARHLQETLSMQDPVLIRARKEVEQAKCDLEYLGISIPATPTSNASSARRAGAAVSSQPLPSNVQLCPRCGSGMTRRVARRGNNVGGAFWGCSRFPRCKGTRNI
jgi:DNA-binding helix-hairpin-helix protein with protein kinase domain